MNILLLGGTGIISSAIAREAADQGHRVTVVNRGATHTRPLPNEVEILQANVRDPQALADVLAGRTFDAAADFVAFTPDHVRDDIETFRGRVGQYVFISSASAYTKPIPHLPITEETPVGNRFWRYSQNKADAEGVLFAEHASSGFPVTVVRPSHTYDRTSAVLGHWTHLDRLRRGLPVVVPGDGNTQWTLTHTEDLARAFVPLLGHPNAIGEAFHITGDETLTWVQIVGVLAHALGAPEPDLLCTPSDLLARFDEHWGAAFLGDKAHSAVFDNAKIKSIAPDWRARIGFHEGAREIVAWFDGDPGRRTVDPRLDELSARIAAFLRRPL